ncbi:MAG: prolipoprotein diacylglyceryl transferase [bacterium]|nr:prolipoprotein diacylglyceryl transferase [bacterium]
MLPILFKLGPFSIYSYGFFLTLAYLAGTFFFWREGKKRGFSEEKLLDLSVLALLAALVGGRILYVLINWNLFSLDPKSSLFLWQGGFAYFGSLFAAVVVVWYFVRAWKWPFFQIADLGAIAAALSFTIGKFGTFLAGTDYGSQTNLPWGVVFPNLVGSRHPVQLYEAFVSLLILFFLIRLYFKNIEKSGSMRSGVVFFDYLILSGVARLVLEFFRADSDFVAGVALAQILSLIVATVGAVCLYYFGLRNLRTDLRVVLKRLSNLDFKLRGVLTRR